MKTEVRPDARTSKEERRSVLIYSYLMHDRGHKFSSQGEEKFFRWISRLTCYNGSFTTAETTDPNTSIRKKLGGRVQLPTFSETVTRLTTLNRRHLPGHSFRPNAVKQEADELKYSRGSTWYPSRIREIYCVSLYTIWILRLINRISQSRKESGWPRSCLMNI